MDPSVREQLRLRHCGVKLQPLPTCSLEALYRAYLKSRDDMVDIAAGHHLAEVVYTR